MDDMTDKETDEDVKQQDSDDTSVAFPEGLTVLFPMLFLIYELKFSNLS